MCIVCRRELYVLPLIFLKYIRNVDCKSLDPCVQKPLTSTMTQGHYSKFGSAGCQWNRNWITRGLKNGPGLEGRMIARQNPHFCVTFDGFSKNTRKYARMVCRRPRLYCGKAFAPFLAEIG